jgi:hypothetical protein
MSFVETPFTASTCVGGARNIPLSLPNRPTPKGY